MENYSNVRSSALAYALDALRATGKPFSEQDAVKYAEVFYAFLTNQHTPKTP